MVLWFYANPCLAKKGSGRSCQRHAGPELRAPGGQWQGAGSRAVHGQPMRRRKSTGEHRQPLPAAPWGGACRCTGSCRCGSSLTSHLPSWHLRSWGAWQGWGAAGLHPQAVAISWDALGVMLPLPSRMGTLLGLSTHLNIGHLPQVHFTPETLVVGMPLTGSHWGHRASICLCRCSCCRWCHHEVRICSQSHGNPSGPGGFASPEVTIHQRPLS